jgi:hypothetical protein
MALFGYPVARGLSLDDLIRASEKGFGDRQPRRSDDLPALDAIATGKRALIGQVHEPYTRSAPAILADLEMVVGVVIYVGVLRPAGKNTLAPSDFMCRGGMLVSSRLICQSATASRCSQIAAMCQLLRNAVGSTRRHDALMKFRSESS